MVISWYGEGCFKIQSSETVLTSDPFLASTGLSAPRFKSDIVIKTIAPFPPISGEEGVFGIGGAGEYNFKDITIRGFALPNESTATFVKTLYLVEAEGIMLCFLGHISEALDPTVLEHIDAVDILFIPGGGKPFIDTKIAAKLVKNLEPKIVIPSFFKIPGLKRKSDEVKHFLEELNHKSVDPQEKLTIKKKDVQEIKGVRVIVLKP